MDYGVEHSQVYGHTRFGRIYDTGEDLDEQNITVALWPRMSLNLEFFIWVSNRAQGIIRCGTSRTRCTLWGTRPGRRL